jgi:SAM-dependent methyltransferase
MADLLETEGRRRVLDVGCGVGRHALYLAARGFDVTGVDNAPAAVAACKANLAQAGLAATVLEADMARLPFPEGAFDGVVAAQVIHHTDRATLQRIIASITRTLAPRGLFAWSSPSRRHSECGRGREIEPGTWIAADHREGPVPHHYVSEEEIRQLLEAYEIESLEEREQSGDRGPRFHWAVLARRKT